MIFMQRKSVTEERAEVWKVNERVVVAKRKYNARIYEYLYLLNIFFAGVMLMDSNYSVALLNFIGAACGRSLMFKELRGCNL